MSERRPMTEAEEALVQACLFPAGDEKMSRVAAATAMVLEERITPALRRSYVAAQIDVLGAEARRRAAADDIFQAMGGGGIPSARLLEELDKAAEAEYLALRVAAIHIDRGGSS